MKSATASLMLAAALVASSCNFLEPRPDRSRFFVLASLAELGTTVEPCALPGGARLGLGPVSVPDYLEKPELLVRTSSTELTRSITDRWAEPLETMLPRVLADDLSQILKGPRVELYPWYSTDRPGWQIEVSVLRFEPDTHGEVLLVASWQARELGGAHRATSQESRVTRRVESPDAAKRAEAMSAAIGALAQELARATCELAAK
jgi:uncharacterized lipoprotein YmbA